MRQNNRAFRTSLLGSLWWAGAGALLVAGLAACDGAALPIGVIDSPGLDLSAPVNGGRDGGGLVDIAMSPRVEFGIPGGHGVTGEPCQAGVDCRRSMAPGNASAACTKANMLGGHGQITWPDGYCQAPCRTAKNDANGINNIDCPGDTPVCVGSSVGTCYAGCTSVNDCRDAYVCANITGTPTAACVPLAATECDPRNDPRPSGRTCAMGSRCVDYSPDNSYGGCAIICDPVAQDCPPPMSGTTGCITDFQANDGSGDCIGTNENNSQGSPCIFLNDCPAGMMCYGQKCRTYCRTGARPCSNGQSCKDITLSGIQVKFKADKTGICSP